jgi:hypothetical protein
MADPSSHAGPIATFVSMLVDLIRLDHQDPGPRAIAAGQTTNSGTDKKTRMMPGLLIIDETSTVQENEEK